MPTKTVDEIAQEVKEINKQIVSDIVSDEELETKFKNEDTNKQAPLIFVKPDGSERRI